MKKVLFAILLVLVVFTILSCDSLWKHEVEKPVTISFEIPEKLLYSVVEERGLSKTMQSSSGILLNTTLAETAITAKVTLHSATTDAVFAQKEIDFGTALDDTVTFENLYVVGKIVYAQIELTQDGYESRIEKSDTITVVEGLNRLEFEFDDAEALMYTITYNLNGGTNFVNAPNTYTIATPTITLGTPEKIGHTFAGWYTNAGFTGNAITEIAQGSFGNITLYAHFTVNTDTLYFELNGGVGSAEPKVVTFGQAIGTLPKPTKEGSNFSGWIIDDTTIITEDTIWNYHEDKTAIALWDVDIFTVTFDANYLGKPADTTVQVLHGFTVPKPTDPTRDNHIFVGWYKDTGLSNEWDFATGLVTGDMTLFAKWIATEVYLSADTLPASGDGSESSPFNNFNSAKVALSNGGIIYVTQTIAPLGNTVWQSDSGKSITIKPHTTHTGALINVENEAFTLQDITIDGSTITNATAALITTSGDVADSLTLEDGVSVIGGSAGGVYIPGNGILYISGNVTVTGNSKNGETNNISYQSITGGPVRIIGELTGADGAIGMMPSAVQEGKMVAQGAIPPMGSVEYPITDTDMRKFSKDNGSSFVKIGNTAVVPHSLDTLSTFGLTLNSGELRGGSSISITEPNIVMPPDVGITSIYDSCFYYNTDIESIIIPEGVTSIGESAFSNCTNLTSVTMSEGVEEIKALAFADCTSLATINFPNSLTAIWYNSFENCTSLTSITIPKNLTNLDASAFSGCSSLTSITVDSANTTYKDDNNVLYTEDGTKLVLYVNPSNSFTIPSHVTTIGFFAFNGRTNLQSVTIPGTVRTIENYAFSGCTSLSNVSIEEGVEIIGQTASAFSRCSSLMSIILPSTVTSISNYSFSGCDALKTVTIKATSPPDITILSGVSHNLFNTSDGGAPDSVRILVPSASFGTYTGHAQWSQYAAKIEAM